MNILPEFRGLLTLLCIGTLLFFSVGCGGDDDCDGCPVNILNISQDMTETEINAALDDLPDGWTVLFASGDYEFTQQKALTGLNDITITGAGTSTRISFRNQTGGGEGFRLINMTDLTISNLVILNTPGDALKIQDSDGVTISGVQTIWDEPLTTNGAYGIYPVSSSDIVIDNCYAYGAADAGIYVGQSQRAIIRNSKAEASVAGIEVENSIDVEVFNNEVIDNTAGILAFDIFGPEQEGGNIDIHDNNVLNNNRTNFAEEGSFVSMVPAGTGILVMAVRDVEVFDNVIEGNGFISVVVVSYGMICFTGELPCVEDVYFDGVYVHDNTTTQLVQPNPVQPPLGQYLISIFGAESMPWIMTDGVFEDMEDPSGGLCIQGFEFGFVNLNILSEPSNPMFDLAAHDCTN